MALVDTMPAASRRQADRVLVLVLAEADPATAAHVLFLALQAMARRPGRVSQLLVAAEGMSPAAIAGLSALARSAAEEGLHLRILGLPDGLDPLGIAAILLEEAAATGDEVAVDRREGRRRWSRQWLDEAHDVAWRPLFRSGGRYLIVGGLGEVGRALSAELVAVHGATIGIIGRTPVGEATRRHLATIRGASGSVFYASADVTDRAALARAVMALKAAMGGIDGVFNLARLVDNAPLSHKEAETFAAVLAVKSVGTAFLDDVTAGETLDFFIVFSSLAAWFGLAGGADYAAACAIQEGLMTERAARVVAGARHGASLAVAWPQWCYDTELDAARGRRLDAAGLAMIDASAGLSALERAAAAGEAVVAVVAGTPEALAPLAESFADPLDGLSDDALAAYVEGLRAMASLAEPPAASIAERVRDAFATQLQVDPLRIGGDTPFAEFGLDSIKALHVAERLSREFGVSVEPALFFDHPTVTRLAEALDERYGAMVLEPAQ